MTLISNVLFMIPYAIARLPSRTESGRTPETVFTELIAWSLPLIDDCCC
ncbi:hypothetical protein [Nodularia chucula]